MSIVRLAIFANVRLKICIGDFLKIQTMYALAAWSIGIV
jgi:hypothetical protein